MAVDTATKRASVFGFVLPPRLVLPPPDGAVSPQNRPPLAYSYYLPPIPIGASVTWPHRMVIFPESRVRTVEPEPRLVAVPPPTHGQRVH